MISQGDIWWADYGEPRGSEPGYRRPVLVVQSNAFNRSAISTVVCVPLTSNLKWVAAPGNVELRPGDTGLDKISVANVSQIAAINRSILIEHVGSLGNSKLEIVLKGVALVLSRT